MVEQYSRTGEQIIALSIVHGEEVSVDLGHTVGTPWIERSFLILGCFADLPEHFTAGSLVKLDLPIDQVNGFH